ncbi:MAG: tetratricopeptide repeat protein [Gemmatimonadetes bacterium]|jgi:TolA-binding protein|nr:tetratricopeptide repeat protein [Gemmatimonadota bacterium]MBT6145693.1 tetratricopeptide repeat protein [Gemmatimonadota bacterium]MBT7859216.1 tetratricopeptide repeat protein [Gemmatimonadota bacterium]
MNQESRRHEEQEDPFLEWVLMALQYVRDRAQLFIGGAIAIVAALAITQFAQTQRETAREEAANLIFQMMLADGNGQLEQVIDTGEKLIDEYAGTPSAAHGIILLANRYYRVGRYDEAEKLYERYIAEYGESQALLFAARTGVAACHEATGDLEGAATGYVAYADAHPNDRASAIALMDAARCYRVLGDTQQQGAVLGRVTRDFPTSPAAQRARQELQML